MENESSIKEMINNSLKNIRNVLDTNTIVGEPIPMENGITIIPISRISIGFASGGLDLPQKNEKGKKNFGGGGGTGVSVVPTCFLTVYPEGKVEVIPVEASESGPIDQIADMINRAPEIISNIRDVLTGENSGYVESTLNFDDEQDEDDGKKNRKKKNK